MDQPFGSAPAQQAMRRGGGILAVAFALSCVVNVLRLTGPLFMILIYDRVLPSRSKETLVALFMMVAVFLLAQAVVDYARRRILARYGAQFQERLEGSLFARAGRDDVFAPGSTKPLTGLDEVDGLRGFFHSSSLIAIFDFIWAPMFLFVVFVLNPLLGWVCVGGVAVIFVLMQIRMRLIGRRQQDSDEASRQTTDLRTMIAASRQTMRTQAMAGGFAARWLAARRAGRDRAIALKDWTVWFDSLCGMTVLFTRYGVLAVGAWLTLEGQLTIGAMVAATFLVSRVLTPVENFLTALPQIAEARGNWGRLTTLMDAGPQETPGVATDAQGGPTARLSLIDVSVRNPRSGELILKGVTLDVGAGQMIQITGMTGKGKTVLAETILGLWRKAGGAILLHGQNLHRAPDGQAARRFGYVPEQPGFVAGTLAENIAHLDPDPDPARVATAARKACLHAAISALPDGYQTRIDAGASNLARGQRAQLALARAMYHQPDILVIDEPDPMLMDLLPKTLEKTFEQILQAGGAIIVFARKPLAWRQIAASYQIDQGRLRPIRAGANSTAPAARIAVVPEKGKAPGSVAKLVG